MILNSHKSKQFYVVLIKLSIVVGAFYYVYHKFTTNEELKINEFLDFLHQNDLFSIKNMFFLIFLTIFNWFFEILKWQHLVSVVTSISFKNATKQSLGALTASLLTPNRIGEYGAKAVYYPKPLRKKIMLLNLISNMTQMGTTIIFGYIGFFFLVRNYSLDLIIVKISLSVFTFIVVLISSFYFFRKIQYKIKGFSFKKIRDFIKEISLDIKIKAFLFSVIRYLCFSFQFYFLLQLFDVNMDYFSAMMVITSTYLLSSIIPSVLLLDVIIKGGVAVYLFSIVGVNELTILCIVTLMWLLNFVIPSVFGSYYVLNFNFPLTEESL